MTTVNAAFPPSWHGALFMALLIAMSTHLLHPPPSAPLLAPPPVAMTPLSDLPSASSLEGILGSEVLSRIHALGSISDPSFPASSGVNRPFMSSSGAATRSALLSYMSDARLVASVDGAGNVIGRLSCTTNTESGRKALALGSHFDTVRGGGLWDGAYGVLTAIAVAKAVGRRKGGVCKLPFDIAVFAFDDEEGNNDFGTTNFGAKAIAGAHDLPKDVEPLLLRYREVFPEVAGEKDLGAAVAERVRKAAIGSEELLGFIEVHIEQGPVLERMGASVGVVDAIAGQTRLSVTFSGMSGHAGTVPMPGRRDALAAASEAVLVVEGVGRRGAEESVVATVGMLSVQPGSSNVIPGSVTMSVDIRAPKDSVREQAVAETLAALEGIGRAREVEVGVSKTHEVAAVGMSEWLRGVLEEVSGGPSGVPGCVRENCSASFEVAGEKESVVLTSGAGHDTQYMARVTDVAMMFVRCRGGVSHHVDEHVSEEDARQGAWALMRAVDKVAEKVMEV